ncbi:hypothetical protein LINPERHAP1_LOCUS6804 [Linum perenne]
MKIGHITFSLNKPTKSSFLLPKHLFFLLPKHLFLCLAIDTHEDGYAIFNTRPFRYWIFFVSAT